MKGVGSGHPKSPGTAPTFGDFLPLPCVTLSKSLPLSALPAAHELHPVQILDFGAARGQRHDTGICRDRGRTLLNKVGIIPARKEGGMGARGDARRDRRGSKFSELPPKSISAK